MERVPEAVIAAFVAGEEAAEGEFRSDCRTHDTAGEMFLLTRGTWPLAARWTDGSRVRIDVLNSAAPDTHALIATHSRRIGARMGRVVEWQLMNAQRSRSVLSDGGS